MNETPHLTIVDDPHVNGTEVIVTDAPAPEVQPPEAQVDEKPTARYGFFRADLPWPEADDRQFFVDVPQPAKFQRAFRTEVYRPIQNKRVPKLRMIWMVSLDGPMARAEFMLQREGEIIELHGDDTDPALLTSLTNGMTGESMAIWQLVPVKREEAAPGPAASSPPTE